MASRIEGMGEPHQGRLLAALRLGSLQLSQWLPAEVRAGIDPLRDAAPCSHAERLCGQIRRGKRPSHHP